MTDVVIASAARTAIGSYGRGLASTGVQAIISATQAIQTGEAQVALAGGAESMSRGPYWMPGARWGVRSHQRAAAAREQGRFDAQIVPVPVRAKRETVSFERDEHIREDASTDGMAALKAAFKKGRDRHRWQRQRHERRRGRGRADEQRSGRRAGRACPRPGAGVCQLRRRSVDHGHRAGAGGGKVLDRAGVQLSDVQVIELNEAFAAQALAVIDDLGLDEEIVNPNGGAIALGHPIAATGAVLTAKILDEMERRDLELGLVTLCIGGGQGIAMLLGRE
jgi:acetyl-CoA C-acetyltransferase